MRNKVWKINCIALMKRVNKMKSTEEIFKRVTVKEMAVYLLLGCAPDEDNMNYRTRLDDTYGEFEKLVLRCEKKKQFEFTKG